MDEYHKAEQYFLDGKYTLAHKHFEIAAKHGIVSPHLGYIYHDGLGTKQDYTKAKKYFEIAAKGN
ncbi:MAG: hypothetical protein LBV69_03490 [Bacteroidales bacterium]|jgi:TPR repeat protein|nr:hypothetical protein [Bacteroidales bacterium]